MDLENAVTTSTGYRQVLIKLNLIAVAYGRLIEAGKEPGWRNRHTHDT